MRERPSIVSGDSERLDIRGGHLTIGGFWLFLALALSLIAFKSLVVDRVPTPFRRPKLSADGALPGVEHQLRRSYADGLELIGYDQGVSEMPVDDALRLDLYWTARRSPSRRYQTVIHLVGPSGFRWSKPDSFRPRDYQGAPPTYTWNPGRYALDSHEIEPLPGAPPGRYRVVLTVFDRETLAPLSVLNEQGQPAAPELGLGQVTLTAPENPADPSRLGIRHRLDARLGPLTLLGADVDRDQADPGDPVWMSTFWRADEQPEEDLMLRLELLGPRDSSVTSYTRSPVAAWHPTSVWRPGGVWRGRHRLYLPADLSTAVYTWTLSLSPSSDPPIPLSQLSVTAPERIYEEPSVDIETAVPLGDIATLLGANVVPADLVVRPGRALTATLFWRAESETTMSYHVFLHLVDAEGKLVAQSDGIPAGWNRPTTGWVAGEVIPDPRTLNIPAGVPAGGYALVAGLYDPDGERLRNAEGGNAVSIASVTVKKP